MVSFLWLFYKGKSGMGDPGGGNGRWEQLIVIIFDKITAEVMKAKKKTVGGVKKVSKKPVPSKPIMLIDKTIATTKQKTHTTIEEAFQISEVRASIRSARNPISRLSCSEKMEECNLSPFSSPGGSSISPQYRKATSPLPKEDKDKKKCKSKPNLTQDRPLLKTKTQALPKREPKLRAKLSKEESNQVAYETLLMRKMNEKKITELSEESSASITKLNKLNLNIKICREPTFTRSCNGHVRDLKQKIEEKYRKELPNLKHSELKFFCSMVLVQRLWRQRKIKSLISEFISPRSANLDQNFTVDSQREQSLSKLDTTATTQEQTSELIRKYHHLSISSEKKGQFEKEVRSTQIGSLEKINLKDLELSAELTPERERKMMRFVECMRDIAFSKPKKNTKKSKMNVFNLQESLSEKCLMQQFYYRVFKDSPAKKSNFELFSLKKQEKNLERSIELINTMKSPKKPEIIEVEERFETEFNSSENSQSTTMRRETSEKETETDTTLAVCEENKEVNSLKNLQLVSENIIFVLLNEFAEEFHSFTSRTVLKKKKKVRLPGLKVSSNTIRDYLTGLTEYMLQTYDKEVVRRFRLISPLSFLKIHHQYDEDDDMDEEDEEINMPIVPNSLFYEYQLIYEEKKFVIAEDEKKYSNFLEGLIKIHNLLLANCLSEMLEKNRIDSVVLPWDNKFDAHRHQANKFNRSNLQGQLHKIINSICSSAFLQIGRFHKHLDDPHEEQKILKTINQQYKSEGNDWNCQYEYLQVRMELTKSIEEILLEQLLQEIHIFF